MNPFSFLQMISFVFELASMHSGGYTAPTGFLRWFANSVYDVSFKTCMEGFWEEEALFMHREVVKYDTCYGWWVCVTMLHMLFGKGGTHAMSLKLDTIWTYTASPWPHCKKVFWQDLLWLSRLQREHQSHADSPVQEDRGNLWGGWTWLDEEWGTRNEVVGGTW